MSNGDGDFSTKARLMEEVEKKFDQTSLSLLLEYHTDMELQELLVWKLCEMIKNGNLDFTTHSFEELSKIYELMRDSQFEDMKWKSDLYTAIEYKLEIGKGFRNLCGFADKALKESIMRGFKENSELYLTLKRNRLDWKAYKYMVQNFDLI